MEESIIEEETALIETPPNGDSLYEFQPSRNERLTLILELRRQQRRERRKNNNVLECELDEKRREGVDWCQCAREGSATPNCTASHRLPKSCFCCKEAASANNTYGAAYRCKIGDKFCVCESNEFYGRALDAENLKGWCDILASRDHIRTNRRGANNITAYTNRELRYAAYRSVTLWLHGTLGVKRRLPLSSCIVNAIRQAFPESSSVYTDYISEVEDEGTSDEDFDLLS